MGLVSCAFADRNSLLAGNLAGNLQKSGLNQAFSDAGAVDRAAISRGWGEFPAPGNAGKFRRETGNGSKEEIGAK